MANYTSAGIGSGTGARVANSSYVNTVPGALNTDPDVLAAINGDRGAQARIAASNNSSVYFDPSSIAQAIISSLNLQDPSNYMQSAWDIANLNTMTSQAMAREQMQFQERANAKAMDFNATEAQKTRDWQTMMSNTAHQREIKDLISAGLNPVLSANQGAAVGSASSAQGVTSSGAKGTVDQGAVQALTNAYVQAKQMEMQEKNINMQSSLQEKSLLAQLTMNELSNETNRYMADRGAIANMSSAGMMASANRYSAEMSKLAQQYITDMNYQLYSEGYLGNQVQKHVTGAIGDSLDDFISGAKNVASKMGLFHDPAGSSGAESYINPNYKPLSERIGDFLSDMFKGFNGSKRTTER